MWLFADVRKRLWPAITGHPHTRANALRLTGGQVVAGSNPVSPTRVLAAQSVIGGPDRPENGYPPGVWMATRMATRIRYPNAHSPEPSRETGLLVAPLQRLPKLSDRGP